MYDLLSGGLAAYALNRGGSIHPITIPKEVLENETGIMNPSIFNHNGRLLLNVRHVNYILYHSETKKFPHQWGPLVYVHPENDIALKTHNVMCELDENLNVINPHRVKMTLDTPPTWNFVGLEDARLFSWDGRMFLCGVRRDCYDDKGTGRMEMCEIEEKDGIWTEVARHPIPSTGDDTSYCEKNWMPVLDMPWHFVKWTNPTDLVHFDLKKKKTKSVVHDEDKKYDFPKDLRGGSQVYRINENQRMAFLHETSLYHDVFGRKDGNYAHRVVIWDNDWNITYSSRRFYFFGTHYDHTTSKDFTVEFATGMTLLGNDILISFGLQDNASYILRMPQSVFYEFLKKD